jgi:hypothetical protein
MIVKGNLDPEKESLHVNFQLMTQNKKFNALVGKINGNFLGLIKIISLKKSFL